MRKAKPSAPQFRQNHGDHLAMIDNIEWRSFKRRSSISGHFQLSGGGQPVTQQDVQRK